jgi:hypothetical protein
VEEGEGHLGIQVGEGLAVLRSQRKEERRVLKGTRRGEGIVVVPGGKERE